MTSCGPPSGLRRPRDRRAQGRRDRLGLFRGQLLLAPQLALQAGTATGKSALAEKNRDGPSAPDECGVKLLRKGPHTSDVQCTVCNVKPLAHCLGAATCKVA